MGLFFIYSRPFKTKVQILQQINVKNGPTSIRCRDSNSPPFDHQSPHITTRLQKAFRGSNFQHS